MGVPLPLAAIVVGWALTNVEPKSAKTIVRLWHEAHTSRSAAHDFSTLLSPKTHSYIGLEQHDTIHAIAACGDREASLLSVYGVAHHPDSLYTLGKLVRELENIYSVDWGGSRKQSRLLCEVSYLRNENTTAEYTS